MKRRIFLDLDGVMANFDQHFLDLFQCETPAKGGVNDAHMWELIHRKGDFFVTMPPFEGAKDFFDALTLRGFDPIILTAASKSNYHDTAVQKRKWVRQHLSTEHLILPVYGSASKTLFMHAPGDILIDDWKRNCDRWADAGGTAILHKSYEETMLRLGMIWGMDFDRKSKGKDFQPVYREEDFLNA